MNMLSRLAQNRVVIFGGSQDNNKFGCKISLWHNGISRFLVPIGNLLGHTNPNNLHFLKKICEMCS
jgi:hypothetical protein